MHSWGLAPIQIYGFWTSVLDQNAKVKKAAVDPKREIIAGLLEQEFKDI